MHGLFNDSSLHGQFESFEKFAPALGRLMKIRGRLREVGLELGVCEKLWGRRITASLIFSQVVFEHLTKDQREQILVWVDREGPFWDRPPQHDPNEYFEYLGEPVTDTHGALAEAAFLLDEEEQAFLVSAFPSAFCSSPLQVVWRERPNKVTDTEYQIINCWEEQQISDLVAGLQKGIKSWDDFCELCKRSFPKFDPATGMSPQAKTDFLYWLDIRSVYVARILDLLGSMQKDPFRGIGKPEPLKYAKAGEWSRRITKGHRIVYCFESGILTVSRCKGHYD